MSDETLAKYESSIALNPWEWERPRRTPRPAPVTTQSKSARPSSAERLARLLLRELKVPDTLHDSFLEAPAAYENWRGEVKAYEEIVAAAEVRRAYEMATAPLDVERWAE